MKKENETIRICAWIFLIFGLVLGAVLLTVGVVYNARNITSSKMFASLYFVLGGIAIALNSVYSMCLFIIYKNKNKKKK